MCNSFEGVIESQAIAWFAQGCQYASMLWQRLQRDMPSKLAETIRIAYFYALGDPTQPRLVSNESNEEYYPRDGAESARRSDFRGKMRYEWPNYRYGSQQVVVVDQDQPGAGSSQRQKCGG